MESKIFGQVGPTILNAAVCGVVSSDMVNLSSVLSRMWRAERGQVVPYMTNVRAAGRQLMIDKDP